jgi:hypothetical protein
MIPGLLLPFLLPAVAAVHTLSKGNVSLIEEESFSSSRGLFLVRTNVQPFAVAMASSHAMEFLAARCRVAVAASKLSSTDVAAINVLSGSDLPPNFCSGIFFPPNFPLKNTY